MPGAAGVRVRAGLIRARSREEDEKYSFVKETVDSRQMNAFVALARCGSFTLAAKELFLTQSAVSHAIKALEDDLGCRLVDRLGRRVKLTRKGEQFLAHAEGILRQMKSARGEIETLSKWDCHRLRVGAC